MKPLRIPPLIIDIVQSGLLAGEGILFETRNSCPVCGGKLSGYDTKRKQFAVLLEGNTRHPVHVSVKRFSCRECNTICFADEPFYPGTRIGSPLIDLCRTLGATMPFNRVAVNLLHLGIVIDRGTVRNYMHGSYPDITITNLFGISLPLSIISLSELAARIGEGSRIPGTEALAACGFPSAYRAAPDLRLISKKGNKGEEEKHEKEGDPKGP
jgi:hypothetical protein